MSVSLKPNSGQHRVLVSYSAPQIFLASPNWQKVYAAILSQLPLRNLHWKGPSRSVRTIQELDVTLVAFDSLREEHASQIPVTLLDKPLVHIYVVHCEDSDLEAYRTTLKKQIKDWHTSVMSRKSQEWMILQIIRPDAIRQGNTFFQIKGSVLDKLKTDFNTDKRDRILQMNWITGNENPLAWAEFINKLKECIIYSFDSAIATRQEEVRRSESQQSMPGWNFCTFFILKECLATSFEGMNLHEEALTTYEQLETSFWKVSKEKNMSWFGALIHHDPRDETSPLLSLTRKNYRDLILANTISIFDFRIYLLARQCHILAKMGLMSDITSKAGYFLSAFGCRLREEESLPPLFIQAWIYSSALSVVEQCNTWEIVYKYEPSKYAGAGKGELLDIARSQLDIIGIEGRHLPSRPPFSTALISHQELPRGAQIRFSSETLNAALSNEDAFYELYIAVTNRAIDLYAKAGRRKFALKLHGYLAALELHRGNIEGALNTFTSLPAHYAPHAWTTLESLMLSRALDTHAILQKSQDREWIHIVLSFLKSYVEHHGANMLSHQNDKVDYISTLVSSLRLASEKLDSDLAHPDHPVLSVRVSSNASLDENRDGSYLDVSITNHLLCVFPADEISVTLIGRESEKFRYTCAILNGCQPGKTDVTLFCPSSTSGTFMLDSREVRAGRLLLQSNYRKGLQSQTHSGKPLLVRVPDDPLSLDARVYQSNRIELSKPPSAMVVVTTGRNAVSHLKVRLSSHSVSFRPQQAILLDEDLSDSDSSSGEDDDGDGDGDDSEDEEPEQIYRPTVGGIEVDNVPKDSTLTFLVPHSDASALTAMKVLLEVEYITTDEPSIVRVSRFTRVLITSLPLQVNVEDFFRGTKLISKFTVSTMSHQHIRICDASLDLPPGGLDGLEITPSTTKRRVVTVTPDQPANFLFSLDSSTGPVKESLNLMIKYRMLREEVESIIEKEVRKLVKGTPSSHQHRILVVSKLINALESDAGWVYLYDITGELHVPDVHQEPGEIGELLRKARQNLAEHRHADPPDGAWREIYIPVDVPSMNIVAAARITILSTPFAKESGSDELPALYAGQPISANLTIHTSFHWGSNVDDRDYQFLLRYNIEEAIREWLVSGPKRGDFVARDGETHIVPITLIALHHGEFLLPRISITALPVSGALTMGSLAVPSLETYQIHGAEKVLILPRGGRSTFVVGMGSG